MDASALIGLLKAGFDFERDVLAGIRAKPSAAARTWSYFVPQIRDFVARRDKVAAEPKPVAEDKLATWTAERWGPILAYARERGEWNRHTYGPAPFEPGCRVPEESVTDADRRFARVTA
jgi:hypothetical protein